MGSWRPTRLQQLEVQIVLLMSKWPSTGIPLPGMADSYARAMQRTPYHRTPFTLLPI